MRRVELKNANSYQAGGDDGPEQSGNCGRQSMRSCWRGLALEASRWRRRIARCEVDGVVAKLVSQRGQIAGQFNFTVGGKRRFIGIDDFWIKPHGRGPRSENRAIGGPHLLLHPKPAAARPSRERCATSPCPRDIRESRRSLRSVVPR